MFKPRPPPDRQTIALAERLSQLPLSEDIEAYGPQIVEIFDGAANWRFWAIDERETYWNNLDGRFYMLRRVRNHPVWGKRLFAAFAPD